MDQLSSTPAINQATSQDKILYQIKRQGPQTAKELGKHLGVTTMGIRQHLSQLEDLSLITTTPEESIGRGRPVRRWKLTETGHGRFPDAHAQITSELIISIRDVLGDDAMNKLIDKRTRDTRAHYANELDKFETVQEKLQQLCELRTAEGYMAELETDGGDFILLEHHCPICIAAKTCQGFCESELEVFQTLFKNLATVKREDHIIRGARRCSYRVTPLN